MDIVNNIIASLQAEEGQLTLNLDKKSMIESSVNKGKDNYLELRNKSIRIIVGQLNNNLFNLQFATTFVDKIELQIDFEKQQELELYFQWSNNGYKIKKDQMALAEKLSLPKKLPGGSIQIEIKPMLSEKNDLQYILDIGEKENLSHERISLYIDAEFNLNLKLIDKKGKEFIVKLQKSEFWKPNTWIQVNCSWNQQFARIKTYPASNDKVYSENKVSLTEIDLFYMPINPPMIIGTDLTEKYFSKMTVSELRLFDRPTD